MKTTKSRGSMTIHKVHHRANFCTLPNALLQDKTLSFRARGILTMMLSMPEQWQTYHSWITEQGTEGEDAVRTSLRELEAAGYLTKQQRREKGKMAGFQWDWYSQPVPVSQRTNYRRSPKPGNPSSGLSGSGKTGTIKDPVQKIPNSQKTEPKESEESPSRSSTGGEGFSSTTATWKPSKLTKAQQLQKLRTPQSYPSQDEFEDFLETEGLEEIINYRPDLYKDLCLNKWHKWSDQNNKWSPIRDWQAYVRGLDTTIAGGF